MWIIQRKLQLSRLVVSYTYLLVNSQSWKVLCIIYFIISGGSNLLIHEDKEKYSLHTNTYNTLKLSLLLFWLLQPVRVSVFVFHFRDGQGENIWNQLWKHFLIISPISQQNILIIVELHTQCKFVCNNL
jgi:hypothetical protein